MEGPVGERGWGHDVKFPKIQKRIMFEAKKKQILYQPIFSALNRKYNLQTNWPA